MAQDLKIRVRVVIPPGLARLGLAALCLAAVPTVLSSEQVTMQTFYPAPSAVYQKLLSTRTSWVGRDPGGYLDVGTTAVPPAGTKLVVMDPTLGTDGYMGINTAAPQDRLEVDGGVLVGGTNPGVRLGYNGGPGDTCAGLGQGSYWSSGAGVQDLVLRSPIGQVLLQNAGTTQMAVSGASVGMGMAPSPGAPLAVGGTIVSRGCVGGVLMMYGMFAPGNGCPPNTPCSVTNNTTQVNCPGGTYATWMTGVFSVTQTQNVYFTTPAGTDGQEEGSGYMYCCPCPAGACPAL